MGDILKWITHNAEGKRMNHHQITSTLSSKGLSEEEESMKRLQRAIGGRGKAVHRDVCGTGAESFQEKRICMV